MRSLRPWLAFLGFAVAFPGDASARPPGGAAGSMVGVSVEVDGWSAPLYLAADGSGRFYFEARQGARYAVRLSNRTRERLGVVLVVDGLNAISGESDPGPDRGYWSRPGRMYVLDPWDSTVVRGWRTSLDDIRQFTFVDERASYAARSGKANRKMGWVEVVVYRERRPYVWQRWWDERKGAVDRDRSPAGEAPRYGDRSDSEAGGRSEAPAESTDAAPPAAKAAPEGLDKEAEDRLRALGYSGGAPAPRRSYPGTGWGPSAHDPVEVVQFEPESRPAECVTLRYEYAGALRALGLLPRTPHERDRLAERERAIDGFAKPPRW